MAKGSTFLASFAIVLLVAAAGWARAQELEASAVDQALCRTISTSAAANALSVGFFTRLIWRESSLRTTVTSPAGAQGVAQFMPGTAAERGLADPFDPDKALPEAAKFLAELVSRFGNLGLAAAAYNAGPSRIAAWLAGQGDPPLETRDFVLAITARSLDEWIKAPANVDMPDKPGDSDESCEEIITALRGSTPAESVAATLFAPWGVQLAGNFSKDLALAAFARDRDRYKEALGDVEPFVMATRLRNRGTRAFFRVRLPAPTREAAQQICGKLHRLGGSCVVLRS